MANFIIIRIRAFPAGAAGQAIRGFGVTAPPVQGTPLARAPPVLNAWNKIKNVVIFYCPRAFFSVL
jgi:hypothetical protein